MKSSDGEGKAKRQQYKTVQKVVKDGLRQKGRSKEKQALWQSLFHLGAVKSVKANYPELHDQLYDLPFAKLPNVVRLLVVNREQAEKKRKAEARLEPKRRRPAKVPKTKAAVPGSRAAGAKPIHPTAETPTPMETGVTGAKHSPPTAEPEVSVPYPVMYDRVPP